jgi:seryl-tRNA synthetase
VLLELALVSYAMKKLVMDGFTPIIPPVLIKKQITEGLGYWQAENSANYYEVKDFEGDQPNELYLVGTGEHSVVPMHSNEILEGAKLPMRYAAFSPCFRREAGAAGRDTHGILRVHQFEKVEMVSMVTPDQDETERKKILTVAETILQDLKLPYQVVQLAAGDLSTPAAETIDLETWMPSQNKYRETHSISTTTDFQARRLKIRYKNKPDEPTAFVHILNGTAVALGRTIIAILENNQKEDGSITIPEVLQPYTGFSEIKKKG